MRSGLRHRRLSARRLRPHKTRAQNRQKQRALRRARAWTSSTLWVCDYRTTVHRTLEIKRLERGDFDDFIRCFHTPRETERSRRFSYEELAQRDKPNLDVFRRKDNSLPEPDVLAAQIVENLAAALEQFRSVSLELAGEGEA